MARRFRPAPVRRPGPDEICAADKIATQPNLVEVRTFTDR